MDSPTSVPHLLPCLFTCLWISFLRKVKSGNHSRKPMRAKTYVNAPIVLSLTPNPVILETRMFLSHSKYRLFHWGQTPIDQDEHRKLNKSITWLS